MPARLIRVIPLGAPSGRQPRFFVLLRRIVWRRIDKFPKPRTAIVPWLSRCCVWLQT